MSFIPFRLMSEKNYLSKINPEVRFITSLIIGVSLSFVTKFNIYFIVLGSHLLLGVITRSKFQENI